MRFLAALLIFIFAASPGSGEAQSRFTGPASFDQKTAETLFLMQVAAWELACQAKRANCRTIVPPYVGYGLLPGRFGQYFGGEAGVMVDVRLLGQPFSLLTMTHEMIHYLQFVTGQFDPNSKNYLTNCEREKEAYDLSNKALGGLIKDDPRAVSWEQAAERYYGCSLTSR